MFILKRAFFPLMLYSGNFTVNVIYNDVDWNICEMKRLFSGSTFTNINEV